MYGKKLKWLIRNKGFSQRDIAARLGLPESTVSALMYKEFPDLEKIDAICKVLNVPISRIFMSDTDNIVEVTDQERDLLKAFRGFSEERRVKVLRIIKELGEF